MPTGFVPALPSSPPGITAAPRSVGRWAWAGDGHGGQGVGASVGSSTWVCPFKWSCLLSGFGTQPLSCLRLQRQRIKGLFYLNETLSPTSRWMVDSRVLNARVPVDSGVLASLLDSPSLLRVLHRAGEGCCWVEVPSQERRYGGTDGMVFGCGMASRLSLRPVSFPHCHHAAPRHPTATLLLGALGAICDWVGMWQCCCQPEDCGCGQE